MRLKISEQQTSDHKRMFTFLIVTKFKTKMYVPLLDGRAVTNYFHVVTTKVFGSGI
jgi:hypothetical protein